VTWCEQNSPIFELARVLVRRDQIASFIVNANHSINVMGCRPSIFANLEASAAPEKSRPQKVRE
jgi:hypothetical protein